MQLNTAQDLVNRLPGFLFNDGSNARGFAGTAGNVLIDGARPTSKTDDLSAVLNRIPAANVDHIDVIRGGAPGIDMQGQTVIANVILRSADSTVIIATVNNTLMGHGQDAPGGTLELTAQDGPRAYQVTLTRYGNLNDDSMGNGYRTVTVPGQAPVRDRAVRQGSFQLGWALNLAGDTPLAGGDFGANLTLQQYTTNNDVIYYDPGAAAFYNFPRQRNGELGLHWDGHMGAAALNIVALQRLGRASSVSTSSAAGVNQIFNSLSDTGESILRGTARYPWSDALTIESGGEVAYNYLNGDTSFFSNGAAIALPSAATSANEKRGEIFAQANWKIRSDLALEAGARFEFSTISATGNAARFLDYPKPRLVLSWTPRSDTQYRLRVERVVGQLDFNNFIASSNFSGNIISAGNPSLRPDQRWQVEASYEYHFWDKGAFLAKILHEDITDLVDFVPIGGGLDGPGNIPKARNDQLDLEYALPLDWMGLPGGLFKSSTNWWDSSLRDPVTGQMRPISNNQNHNITFEIQQDVPAWRSTWSIFFATSDWVQPSYRISQISFVRASPPFFIVNWDYTPSANLELHAEIDNALPYGFENEQDLFAGPRNLFPLAEIQDIKTRTEPRLFVQIRKTFN